MKLFRAKNHTILFEKSSEHLSFRDYKRAVLTGQLSLLCFFICVIYIPLDLYSGIHSSWPFQLMGAVMSLTSFVLNRKGRYRFAKIILALSINTLIFIFALVEPLEVGASLLYITCYLGALSIFGFEDKQATVAFVGLTTIFFLISTGLNLNLFERHVYAPDYLHKDLVISFSASAFAVVLMGYFLLSINYKTENSLLKNEKDLARKNKELIKINEELDRFVYSTSHDLRSPISSIRGLINLSKFSNNIDELKSYILMMEDRLLNLNKFISDISDYSRNSRLPVNVRTIQLKSFIDGIIETLKFYPGAEKIKMIIDIPEHHELTSDPTRIQILLGNLISNAIKYADLRKQEPFISIKSTEENEKLSISITDNGMGIHQDHLPKIFEMFFRGLERSEGSGLGLYIVKETLMKVDGTIAVTSQLGEGSTFTMVLPKNINNKYPPEK
jgi:signal transduction histidine kinase